MRLDARSGGVGDADAERAGDGRHRPGPRPPVRRGVGSGRGAAPSTTLPRLLGLGDGPFRVGDHHRLVSELARRFAGVRLDARRGAVLESLVPAILEQKVTGEEARRAWRGLIAVAR